MPPKAKKTTEKKAKKGPKQGTLSGMEDRALAELEEKAEEYADIRDQRMDLTKQEGELNDDLLLLMKKHKKTEYHHADVHCWVQAVDEKVKVKIGELPAKKKTTQKATDFPPPEPEITTTSVGENGTSAEVTVDAPVLH
jgi:hypothetical protein